MNYKILILSIGSIRQKNDFYFENLKKIKYLFETNNSVEILFSTWNPVVSPNYFFIDSIYEYDYSKEDLLNKLKYEKIESFFLDQPRGESIAKLKNGAPSFSFYHLIECANFLSKSKLKYDFIIKTRHDLKIDINNIDKYLVNKKFFFKDKVFIPKKNYWSDYKTSINDHLFITNYNSFINKSRNFKNIDQYNKIVNKSWDMEELMKNYYKKLGNIDFIKSIDIIEYEVMEFGHKNLGKKFI